MMNINMMQLTASLAAEKPEYGLVWANQTAARLVSELDPRLAMNVQEWMEHRSLSDVSVRASDGRIYSVSRLMMNGCDFLTALDCVNDLMHGNEIMALAGISRRRR